MLKGSRMAKRAGALIIGLVIAAAVLAEQSAYRRMERRYQAALAAQQQLAGQLHALQADRDHLAESLAALAARAETLAQALSGKDQELQQVMNRLTHEELVIKELQAKLDAIQYHYDLLEGELAMALQARASAHPTSEPDSRVRLEKVIVKSPLSSSGQPEGRVLSVHPQWRFVVTNLGWNVVRLGDIVSISRSNQLLGKARVERVQENASAATLLPEWQQVDIQINDMVRAL